MLGVNDKHAEGREGACEQNKVRAYQENSHPASLAELGLYAPGAIMFLRSHSLMVWSLQLLIR